MAGIGNARPHSSVWARVRADVVRYNLCGNRNTERAASHVGPSFLSAVKPFKRDPLKI